MNNPKKHHHVPQFLLGGWCRDDGKLAVYSRKNNQLVIDWHTPEHTAFEPHLYRISALPAEDQQWVEREVMSKAVDGPAATILRRLQSGELGSFDSNDRSAWTRFMLAQWVRSPEMIAKIRRDGRDALLRSLETNPEEYLAVRGDSPHSTLLDWVNANAEGLDEIVSMGSVLPRMITDAGPGGIVINMRWEVLHLTGSKTDLLTSDQPVVRLGGLKSRACMIVIPLDPRRLFVASHYDRGFQRFAPDKIAKEANKTIVAAARVRVFGSGLHHKPLAEKYLCREGRISSAAREFSPD
jgi:hypothetical protein